MPAGQPPESAEPEDVRNVPGVDVASAVTLAGQGQHSVRPRGDVAIDVPGEVHAEEREGGVGDRVDERVDQAGRRLDQCVVVAPERHGPVQAIPACHLPDPVGVEPRTAHHEAGLDLAARGVDEPRAVALCQRGHLVRGSNLRPSRTDLPGQARRHRAEVDDAGLGQMQGPNPHDVWFDLPKPFRADLLQPRDPVGRAVLLQARQAGQLIRLHRHDHLPAPPEGDSLLLCEPLQSSLAVDAEAGLERPGPVVQTGVQDPRVVGGLVGAQLRFLLQDGQAEPGPPLQEAVRRGESEDAAADDGDVDLRPHPTGAGIRGRQGRRPRPSGPSGAFLSSPSSSTAIG